MRFLHLFGWRKHSASLRTSFASFGDFHYHYMLLFMEPASLKPLQNPRSEEGLTHDAPPTAGSGLSRIGGDRHSRGGIAAAGGIDFRLGVPTGGSAVRAGTECVVSLCHKSGA